MLEPHLLLISNLGWQKSFEKQLSQLQSLRSSPDAKGCQPAWLPVPDGKILHLCSPTSQTPAFSLFKPRSLDVSSTVAFTRACTIDGGLEMQ